MYGAYNAFKISHKWQCRSILSNLISSNYCVVQLISIDSTIFRFADKTNNSWEDRDSFVKVTGKYDLLKIDYEAKVRQL